MIENIVTVSAILIVLFDLYRFLRALWLRRLIEHKKKARRPRKPMVLKPKSEHDCRFCKEEKGKRGIVKREPPEPWSMQKGRGGRKKRISTEEYFCSNPCCDYYRITDEKIGEVIITLSDIMHKGKQHPRQYRYRTPAMAAGLTDRRWTVKELLHYPLP